MTGSSELQADSGSSDTVWVVHFLDARDPLVVTADDVTTVDDLWVTFTTGGEVVAMCWARGVCSAVKHTSTSGHTP